MLSCASRASSSPEGLASRRAIAAFATAQDTPSRRGRRRASASAARGTIGRPRQVSRARSFSRSPSFDLRSRVRPGNVPVSRLGPESRPFLNSVPDLQLPSIKDNVNVNCPASSGLDLQLGGVSGEFKCAPGRLALEDSPWGDSHIFTAVTDHFLYK